MTYCSEKLKFTVEGLGIRLLLLRLLIDNRRSEDPGYL